jgi:hypothetical protein
MPKPIPVPIRRLIFTRMQDGQPPTQIARELGLALRTTENLCRRFRDRGEAGIRPDYHAPAHQPHAYAAEVRSGVLAYRRDHPRWGAGWIRVVLAQEHPEMPVPAERTVRGWLQAAGLGPPPQATRSERRVYHRATRPHECWQIDAAEKVPLADGSTVSWLRIVDECSGAVLATAVFPPRLLVAGATDGHPRPAAGWLCPLG